MGQQLAIVLVAVGGILVLGVLVLIARTWRQVDQGYAMIVNKMGKEPKVTFTGAIVLPIVNKAEIMDLSVKTIEVSRHGKEGLICADNIRADIKVTFFVRVNKTVEDVLEVAQTIGCIRASQQTTLGAVRGEVLRGAQDRRQADGVRAALHAPAGVQGPDQEGHR